MHVDSSDGVLELTFDRPGVRNAISKAVAEQLVELLSDVSPAEYDAIVLSGEGDAFSAGGDLEAMTAGPDAPRAEYEAITDSFGQVVEAMLECPVPIVAKIDGDAVGAGLAIAALSDIAYASTESTFSCAFVRVGLIPDTGGTFMLPRLVGLRTAKKLAFTGEFFDAEYAAEIDLINEAVSSADLEERVTETVERLGRRPTDVIGMTKQALHENMGRPWDDALEYETMLQVQARHSDAHEEGVTAFIEGRQPEFDV
ncbi:enoyl-CoA hydratase/isomerase family protein [Natronolimnobius sp. AArcel1]|uniref:enoyl-CoA hydratase/isomerase family protein n=1 Tax=Natronolimnobius sp. AArcel1 TaxID=1679093 RepID=UPI0013EB2654|nr:enoyl-CoA hydratase/isomerase family protein [Natronolimnobius sp. AArcel1]NGM70993.1 enoyl-CoA hydratase/isomerase family protein [Natronolimnobius sp. AArcel1]